MNFLRKNFSISLDCEFRATSSIYFVLAKVNYMKDSSEPPNKKVTSPQIFNLLKLNNQTKNI